MNRKSGSVELRVILLEICVREIITPGENERHEEIMCYGLTGLVLAAPGEEPLVTRADVARGGVVEGRHDVPGDVGRGPVLYTHLVGRTGTAGAWVLLATAQIGGIPLAFFVCCDHSSNT